MQLASSGRACKVSCASTGTSRWPAGLRKVPVDAELLAEGCREAVRVGVSIRFLKQLLPSGERLPGTPLFFWRSLQSRLRHHGPFLLKLLQSRQRRQIALMGRLYGLHRLEEESLGRHLPSNAQQVQPYWMEFLELLGRNGHLSLTSAARELHTANKARVRRDPLT